MFLRTSQAYILLSVLVLILCTTPTVEAEEHHGSIQSDTTTIIDSYTICTSDFSKSSTDTTSRQSPVTSQQEQANHFKQSHHFDSDSGSEKTQETFSDELSRYRSCSSLQFLREHEFSSTIKDFQIGEDTTFTQIVIADTFFTFDGKTLEQSVPLDTNVQVYLNRGSSTTTARCRDLTEGLVKKDKKSLDCRFFDSDGDTIRQKYFYNNAGGRQLTDTVFLVAEGGKLRLYDYRNDSTVWKDDRVLDQVFFSPNSRYLLVSFTGISGTTNELRKLKTGETINLGGELITTQGVDSSGKFIYQVLPDPGSRTRKITIYNQNFEQLQSVENLPFENQYNGRFDISQSRLWIPRNDGSLFTANFREKSSDTFSYPYSNFTPEAFDLSSEQDRLYIYGFRGSRPPGSITSKNYDRYLLIFNLSTHQFSPVIYRFSKQKHNFDNLHEPDIRVFPSGLLAVQHPRKLVIYSLNFRSR